MENPYDAVLMAEELQKAWNGPPILVPSARYNLAMYPPSAFPILAPFAYLPWRAANVAWCAASVGAFLLSLKFLLKLVDLTTNETLTVIAAALFFSPTQTGIATGNPSVLAISMTTIAICLAWRNRQLGAGLLLGMTIALKPQTALPALVTMMLWGYWSSIITGLAVATVFLSAGLVRALSLKRLHEWLTLLQQNITYSFMPGSLNDPSPNHWTAYQIVNVQSITSLFTNSSYSYLIGWLLGAGVLICYCYLRRAAIKGPSWQDACIVCCLSLMLFYHRYYDAQLLLVFIPLIVWRRRMHIAWTLLVLVCLLLLAFPLQAMLALSFRSINESVPLDILLFRHQSLAIVALCLLCLKVWRQEHSPDLIDELPTSRRRLG